MDSYKQQQLEETWDAIVIGSGMGGLTAAAMLSKYVGKKVLVLERHYAPGGYTHAFHRPGYTWDVGVHYIGEMQNRRSAMRVAFDQLTDGALEWNPMPDVYDRVLIGGREYEFPTGEARLRARLKGYFPREPEAIDRYFTAVNAARKASGLYFAEKAVPRPIARVAGGWMRRSFMRWAGRTTLEVLRELTSNEELIGVLTAQWGDYGLPPGESSFGVHAVVAGHYFEGASYPVGGAARIAETMTPVIARNGGRVVV